MTSTGTWAEPLMKRAGIVGVAALGLLIVGAVAGDPDQFFRSWLIGFMFWLSIAFGSLGIQMIHALTGGRWGPPIRRTLLAASTTLPLLAILFLPLLAGMKVLYPWARPEVVAKSAILMHKAPYLNVGFFVGRAALCFTVWCAFSFVLYKRTLPRLNKAPSAKMRRTAGPGLLACAMTMSMAAIDWLMTLDPVWFSTMFPVIVVIGTLLSAHCFAILVLLYQHKATKTKVAIDPLHDLGNLLLVFVMVWGYLSFSQYLIIYAGNMAEDATFYVHRSTGGWQVIAFALIVLHFAVPFLVLISRRSKRSPRILLGLAGGVLSMRLIEVFWVAAPEFYDHQLRVHWMDLVAWVAIGGIWIAAFLHRLSAKELKPAAAQE